MNVQKLFRRNRFKKPAKVEPRGRRWPLVLREWRSYARRTALLVLIAGALAALTWALDRPIRVISMDGAFQRVSPGQIEKAVAPFTQAGFMSADLDRIQRAVERVPWVDHARVQRRFPNSLHVTVVEETASPRCVWTSAARGRWIWTAASRYGSHAATSTRGSIASYERRPR